MSLSGHPDFVQKLVGGDPCDLNNISYYRRKKMSKKKTHQEWLVHLMAVRDISLRDALVVCRLLGVTLKVEEKGGSNE